MRSKPFGQTCSLRLKGDPENQRLSEKMARGFAIKAQLPIDQLKDIMKCKGCGLPCEKTKKCAECKVSARGLH